MQLRDYQAECVESIFRDFAHHRSVLAVLATGTGKTVIGSEVIRRWMLMWQGRVLWLAHREELIEQAAETIRALTGLPVAVEMGENYADEHCFAPASVVIASVQTLIRFRRRRRFKPERFGLIIVDEAHHALARSYREIIKYFREGDQESGIVGNPELRHLGITATPKRSDDLAMGKVYDHVSYEFGIAQAVQDGWLVPVRQATAIVEDLDISQLDIVGGDYVKSQLEAVLTDPEKRIVYKMVKPIIDHSKDQQTIVFTVGKKQARLMADALNDAKPGSAVAVTDETPKEERRGIIAEFRRGNIQYFANCGIAVEGFDSAPVSLVAIARPTKSLSLYAQMLGRATRPLSGVVDGPGDAASRKLAIAKSAKPFSTILDFVGNVERHGESVTVSAADILGGNYPEDVREYAKRAMLDKPGARPVEETLERSAAEIDLLREEEERKARIVAESEYRVRYLEESQGPRREYSAGLRGEPASHKQVWKLMSLGVPRQKAEKCTKKQASGWIGRLLAEMEAKR